jgi:hypothetical protein
VFPDRPQQPPAVLGVRRSVGASGHSSRSDDGSHCGCCFGGSGHPLLFLLLLLQFPIPIPRHPSYCGSSVRRLTFLDAVWPQSGCCDDAVGLPPRDGAPRFSRVRVGKDGTRCRKVGIESVSR